MYCLKCGKETAEEHIFCDSCLEVMAEYPVKPETKVHLPHRPEVQAAKKQPRKRVLQPEEQLALLHRLVRRLIVALVAVTVLFALSAAGLLHTFINDDNTPTVGRNYTIDTGRRP